MIFLVDTNVVSDLRNTARANSNVRRWAASLDAQDAGISVITLLELQYGARIGSKKNPALAEHLVRWIAEVVRPHYEGRILAIDDRVALKCAELIHPHTRPLNDAFIAATALVHDLTIVTRDVDDFEPMGVRLFNPWDA